MRQPTTLEELVTYQEAANELHRSLPSIYRAVSQGVLHSIKIPFHSEKFFDRSEIEWFKGRPLTLPYAEEYRIFAEKQSQDNDQFLEEYAVKDKAPSETDVSLLDAPEIQKLIFRLAPLLYSSVVISSDADVTIKNELRQDMLEYIQHAYSTDEGKDFLKKFAHILTEKLSQRKLSFTERKIYRELLDATLTIIAVDPETAIA